MLNIYTLKSDSKFLLGFRHPRDSSGNARDPNHRSRSASSDSLPAPRPLARSGGRDNLTDHQSPRPSETSHTSFSSEDLTSQTPQVQQPQQPPRPTSSNYLTADGRDETGRRTPYLPRPPAKVPSSSSDLSQDTILPSHRPLPSPPASHVTTPPSRVGGSRRKTPRQQSQQSDSSASQNRSLPYYEVPAPKVYSTREATLVSPTHSEEPRPPVPAVPPPLSISSRRPYTYLEKNDQATIQSRLI